MKRPDKNYQNLLDYINSNFTLEELSDFINIIKSDQYEFICDLIRHTTPVCSQRVVEEIDSKNDMASTTIIDLINYYYTKNENVLEKLVELLNILSKTIIPAGALEGKFKSLSIEECQNKIVARLFFSEDKNIMIKAKNNILEIEM